MLQCINVFRHECTDSSADTQTQSRAASCRAASCRAADRCSGVTQHGGCSDADLPARFHLLAEGPLLRCVFSGCAATHTDLRRSLEPAPRHQMLYEKDGAEERRYCDVGDVRNTAHERRAGPVSVLAGVTVMALRHDGRK